MQVFGDLRTLVIATRRHHHLRRRVDVRGVTRQNESQRCVRHACTRLRFSMTRVDAALLQTETERQAQLAARAS